MTESPDISYLTFVAIQAALFAGEILRKGFGTSYTITSKPGRQNLVTEYDNQSEDRIISFIRQHFPDHTILAEESGLSDEFNHNKIHWLIDPLDGTTNFVRHLPLFTISICATLQGKELVGVIYQPITHELFVAQKGKGAYLNGEKLKISQTSSLDAAIIGSGFPYTELPQFDQTMNQLVVLSRLGITLRNFGSAALALAYVAAGRLDGFWMINLYPWDIAAGKLLIEEAGGLVTLYNYTKPFENLPINIIAANQKIHDSLMSQVVISDSPKIPSSKKHQKNSI